MPLCIFSQRPTTQERANVGRYAALDHGIQPIAEARPALCALGPVADESPLLLRQVQEAILDAPTCRCRGPPLAHDLGRDPLCDFGEGARIVHQWEMGVTENVNEARADDHALRVHHLVRCLHGDASGRRDLKHTIPLDGDIPIEPRIAGTIYDLRTSDQNIDPVCSHFFSPHSRVFLQW